MASRPAQGGDVAGGALVAREWVEEGGIALEPAEGVAVDLPNRLLDGAVELAEPGRVAEARGEFGDGLDRASSSGVRPRAIRRMVWSWM
ncbi:MAG: hypothetical protein U0841_32575 [Chloroflexia bacterium]